MSEYRINTVGGVIELEPGQHWIDITHGMSGYFAVQMWLNNEDMNNPFPEPYDTGFGRYRTPKEAYEEAKDWANDNDLPLVNHPELK
jgi:hypothetical protein